MKVMACLLSKEECKNPVNIGIKYALTKKADWIDITDMCENGFIAHDINKGINFMYKDNKAYSEMKTYMLLDEGNVVVICTESLYGCDVPVQVV